MAQIKRLVVVPSLNEAIVRVAAFDVAVMTPAANDVSRFRHAAAGNFQDQFERQDGCRSRPSARPIAFITNLSSVEWIEFKSPARRCRPATLQGAAGNAMLTVQATNALRALFVHARLL